MLNIAVASTMVLWTATVPISEPDGGGPGSVGHDHMPREKVVEIERQLADSIDGLRAQGVLREVRAPAISGLIWPLRARSGYTAPDYSGVSNFVDLNVAVPNQLLDFNCGSRSYDLVNGYNHGGIDYFIWPFSWRLMDQSLIEVVAAAPGQIIFKVDNFPDRSCVSGAGDWNAVYVRHDDGTVMWYGHLKTGSATSKPIGSSVVAGEYLGLVGSSGSSTGPHLHMELRSAAQGGTFIEPHAGACRAGNTLWASQRPYYDGKVVMLATHGAPPNMSVPCPNPTQEQPNFKGVFRSGENAIFAAYYRDQQRGDLTTYRIRRPDGSIFSTWQHAMNDPASVFYAASYWYWQRSLPADAPGGTWRFETTYRGQETITTFIVDNDQLLRSGFES